MILYFVNVGREKKSWSLEVSDLATDSETEQLVNRAIKKSKALRSSDFDWDLDFESGHGAIYVGMGRKVGEIHLAMPLSAEGTACST